MASFKCSACGKRESAIFQPAGIYGCKETRDGKHIWTKLSRYIFKYFDIF